MTFERKIMRNIYGSILDNEDHRIIANQEIYQMYLKANAQHQFIYRSYKRLEWATHVWRSNGISGAETISQGWRLPPFF